MPSMTTHAENAIGFLQAAQEARRMLDAEYDKPSLHHECQVPGEPTRRCEHQRSTALIGELNAHIAFALAAAKIESQLAVSEALMHELAQLRAAVTPPNPLAAMRPPVVVH